MNKQVQSAPFSIKRKTTWQKLLGFSALFSCVVSMGAYSANEKQPYEELSKQLNIMNNIFTSSLQTNQDKFLKKTKIESLYLAGQGVVFTVKSSSSSWNRNGFNFVFPDAAVPVPPTPPAGEDFEFFEQQVEIEEHIESAFEQQREHSRQVRDQQRELSYELRDIEREIRDIAYQLRSVNKSEKETLAKEQTRLDKKKAALEKVQEAINKKSQEMKQKLQIQQDKKLAARKAHYQKLSTSLVETLCTYGNSLKALPKNEYISLVLKSAGDKVVNNYRDKIIVLSKRDISECAVDKISAEKLLTSTKNYQF
jgi:hypothetical protein